MLRNQAGLVAICSDGCSQGAHSEVGAKIGARLVATEISRHLEKFGEMLARLAPEEEENPHARLVADLLDRVRQDVLAYIRILVNGMGGGFSKTVEDYFLFTIVGAVITPDITWTFNLGDGVIIANGQQIDISAGSNNEPPYMAYDLVPTTRESRWRFQTHAIMPSSEFKNLLIGTDGVADLIASEGKPFPGRPGMIIGNISQLWQEDKYYKNTDMVRRHLAMVNKDHQQPDYINKVINREVGYLKDDTSLVVIRQQG
jgi:hypothetical protein